MLSCMELEIKYRGKVATTEDVAFINELIAQNPNDSRRALSRKICRAWNWVQPNGELRDMVCRGFLLTLHRAGYIRLPPARYRYVLPTPKKPPLVKVDDTPITADLKQLGPLKFRQVRRSRFEPMFNSLIEQYHYLGYCKPVGEHLKFMVFAGARPVACLACSSPARHIGSRDRFIGWTPQVRKQNLHLLAYNGRFLILPWIHSKNLASYILARLCRILPEQWNRFYHHPVYFIETFIDTQKFKGISYKAANWTYLGDTTGRGKNDQTNLQNRSTKEVWGYPLVNNFRSYLCNGAKND